MKAKDTVFLPFAEAGAGLVGRMKQEQENWDKGDTRVDEVV